MKADRQELALELSEGQPGDSMHQVPQHEGLERLIGSIATTEYITGKTYGFYHYPARFHPDVARAAIEAFSAPGDLIFDPFMGGGTSVIEALALGRRALGVDVNELASFVADVRTTPLSSTNEHHILMWALCCKQLEPSSVYRPRSAVINFPKAIETFMAEAVLLASTLPSPREQAFARCALLRLGQLAFEKTTKTRQPTRRSWLAERLPLLVEDMLSGMREFVAHCQRSGIRKNQIRGRRELATRSIVGLESDPRYSGQGTKPKLVITSPPYPGVHVLYHRWQYRGRKETSAPYWIANVKDGCGSSFYTLGDIKPAGVEKYFSNVKAAFSSIRALVAEGAWLIQLVGFSNLSVQLPRYLDAMRNAGFVEWESRLEGTRSGGIPRLVPNRRWYTRLREPLDASNERLLIHRAG